MSQGQGGGRPLKFKSVKKLQEAIDAYFYDCDPHLEQVDVYDYPWIVDEAGKRHYDYEAGRELRSELQMSTPKAYTTTGLAIALDTDRSVLLDYGDGKYDSEDQKFSYTVKTAKRKVQLYAEDYLYTGKNTAGAIFNLKNNHNWVDRQEQDLTSNGKDLQVPILGGLAKEDDAKE